jgi:hypothetical protein
MCAFNVGTESAGQVAEYLEKNLHNSNNLFLGSRNLFSSFNSLEKCFGQKISSKKEVKKINERMEKPRTTNHWNMDLATVGTLQHIRQTKFSQGQLKMEMNEEELKFCPQSLASFVQIGKMTFNGKLGSFRITSGGLN